MRSDIGQSIQSSDYARYVLKLSMVATVINTVLYIRHFARRVGLTSPKGNSVTLIVIILLLHTDRIIKMYTIHTYNFYLSIIL